MRAAFVEVSAFTEWVTDSLTDHSYLQLQQELLRNPDKGTVMPGCGGLRKLRVSDPHRNKGKRGGARVIYLYVPEAKWFYMLDGYGKDEQDDLSTDEKKGLSKLAEQLKIEAKSAAGRSKGKK